MHIIDMHIIDMHNTYTSVTCFVGAALLEYLQLLTFCLSSPYVKKRYYTPCSMCPVGSFLFQQHLPYTL